MKSSTPMPTPTPTPWRPTPQQLAAAAGVTIPDLIAPSLDVLFCGINPGLYSGAVGHHFARPGNRFWPALHLSGFTDRILSPFEESLLLDRNLGITNIVPRTTARADELTPDELRAGGQGLRKKIIRLKPRFLAILGISAYRLAFHHKHATLGPQPQSIAQTRLWILPNPSGLNAHYTLKPLADLFAQLRRALSS